MNKRWLRVVGKIIVILTALFFIQAGIQKVIGTEQMTDMFEALGYSGWFGVVVGCLEVAGGLGLLIPRLKLYAAAGLGILMIGAIISELWNDRLFESTIPAQWFIVLALILYFQIRSNRGRNRSGDV